MQGCGVLSWEMHKIQSRPIGFHLSLSHFQWCTPEPLAVKVLLAEGDYFVELG